MIEDGDAILHVIDDGVGFDDSLDTILQKGYALRNIRDRIQLYYGSDYGIDITSAKGTGCRVSVRIKLEI